MVVDVAMVAVVMAMEVATVIVVAVLEMVALADGVDI